MQNPDPPSNPSRTSSLTHPPQPTTSATRKGTFTDPDFILEEKSELEGLTDFLQGANLRKPSEEGMSKGPTGSNHLQLGLLLNLVDGTGQNTASKGIQSGEKDSKQTTQPHSKSPQRQYTFNNSQYSSNESNRIDLLGSNKVDERQKNRSRQEQDMVANTVSKEKPQTSEVKKVRIEPARIPSNIKLQAFGSLPKPARGTSPKEKGGSQTDRPQTTKTSVNSLQVQLSKAAYEDGQASSRGDYRVDSEGDMRNSHKSNENSDKTKGKNKYQKLLSKTITSKGTPSEEKQRPDKAKTIQSHGKTIDSIKQPQDEKKSIRSTGTTMPRRSSIEKSIPGFKRNLSTENIKMDKFSEEKSNRVPGKAEQSRPQTTRARNNPSADQIKINLRSMKNLKEGEAEKDRRFEDFANFMTEQPSRFEQDSNGDIDMLVNRLSPIPNINLDDTKDINKLKEEMAAIERDYLLPKQVQVTKAAKKSIRSSSTEKNPLGAAEKGVQRASPRAAEAGGLNKNTRSPSPKAASIGGNDRNDTVTKISPAKKIQPKSSSPQKESVSEVKKPSVPLELDAKPQENVSKEAIKSKAEANVKSTDKPKEYCEGHTIYEMSSSREQSSHIDEKTAKEGPKNEMDANNIGNTSKTEDAKGSKLGIESKKEINKPSIVIERAEEKTDDKKEKETLNKKVIELEAEKKRVLVKKDEEIKALQELVKSLGTKLEAKDQLAASIKREEVAKEKNAEFDIDKELVELLSKIDKESISELKKLLKAEDIPKLKEAIVYGMNWTSKVPSEKEKQYQHKIAELENSIIKTKEDTTLLQSSIDALKAEKITQEARINEISTKLQQQIDLNTTYKQEMLSKSSQPPQNESPSVQITATSNEKSSISPIATTNPALPTNTVSQVPSDTIPTQGTTSTNPITEPTAQSKIPFGPPPPYQGRIVNDNHKIGPPPLIEGITNLPVAPRNIIVIDNPKIGPPPLIPGITSEHEKLESLLPVCVRIQADNKPRVPGLADIASQLSSIHKGGAAPDTTVTSNRNQVLRKKLKAVFIEAIAHAKGEKTVYAELKAPVEIKFDDLEELFENAPVKKATPAEGDPKADPKKKELVCLITDSKRVNNITIMVMKFRKYTMPQLKDAIVSLDPKIITPELCPALLSFCPQPEEVKTCEEYDGPPEDLDGASQYLYYISQVPRMSVRLNMLVFKSEFQEKIDAELESVKVIQKAYELLKKSESLMTFLKISLDLANTLNEGTSRSNAQGLKPASLLSFANVRSNKPGLTLLTYMLKKINEQKPEILDFTNDYKDLDNGSKVNLDEPLKELNAIKSQVDQLQTQIDMKLNPPDTAFNDTFQPFVVSGAPIINNALELGNTVKSQYIETAKFLGEDEAGLMKKTTVDFFGTFKQLFDIVKKFKVDEEERKKREARAAALKK